MREGRPSHTAVKIGLWLVFLGQEPQLAALLPEGAVESTRRLMTAAGLLKPWHLSLFRSRAYRLFARWLERRMMPGQFLHVALRKRFIDDETRAGIAQGATQVLSAGAGFDTLCLRLAEEFPDVTFVEVDHPATQAAKRGGVEALGPIPPNFHLHSADLAGAGLEEALAAVDTWRRDAQSVVVAEGLLMYLDEADVCRFLEAVRRNVAAGSRLLFTYMQADERGRLLLGKLGWLALASLEVVGEPLRWGVRKAALEPFLQRHEFALESSSSPADLRSRYLKPAALSDRRLGSIEFMAVGRVGQAGASGS
jgi:methyltransferase (TIGR00027 family)